MRFSVVVSALIAVIVGFGGSVAIVLAGADALGATPAQKATWVSVLCLSMMATTGILSILHRVPIVTAWSTPGAALLAGASGASLEQAVGAFLVAGLLIVLTGLVPLLERLISRIPGEVASAMLAGVLFAFVVDMVRAIPGAEVLVLPLLLLFMAVRVISPIWAVLAVLVAGVGLTMGLGLADPVWSGGVAEFSLVRPVFEPGTMLGIGVPLYLVTMASQNLPGFAVLRSAGYRVPGRSILLITGFASTVTAFWGAHSSNLAAITASICTGRDAHPDPAKRWLCGPVYALGYAVLALTAIPMVALFASLPPALIAVVAGAALLGPFMGSLQGAMTGPSTSASVMTFVVTASGVSLMGIGAAFWGLCTGLLVVGLEWVVSGLRKAP